MTVCTVGRGRRNTKNMSSAAISSTALITMIKPCGIRRELDVDARPGVRSAVGASGGNTGSAALEISFVNSLGPALAFTSGAAPPSADNGVDVPLPKIGGGRIPGAPADGAPADGAPDGGPAAAKSGEACAGGAGGGGAIGVSGGNPPNGAPYPAPYCPPYPPP